MVQSCITLRTLNYGDLWVYSLFIYGVMQDLYHQLLRIRIPQEEHGSQSLHGRCGVQGFGAYRVQGYRGYGLGYRQ